MLLESQWGIWQLEKFGISSNYSLGMCHAHRKKNVIMYTQIVARTQSRITVPSPPSTLSQSVSFLKITTLNRVRYSNASILIIFPADNKYERELDSLIFPGEFVFRMHSSAIHTDLAFCISSRPSTCKICSSISTGNISEMF